MTRINCVPVEELTDAHLGAEYRELPRVFGLVRCAQQRGVRPSTLKAPKEYTLGAGHVKFFYGKLRWLHDRHRLIVDECLRRGRVVNFHEPPDTSDIHEHWFGSWEPRPEDFSANRERIALRLAEAKHSTRRKANTKELHHV